MKSEDGLDTPLVVPARRVLNYKQHTLRTSRVHDLVLESRVRACYCNTCAVARAQEDRGALRSER